VEIKSLVEDEEDESVLFILRHVPCFTSGGPGLDLKNLVLFTSLVR